MQISVFGVGSIGSLIAAGLERAGFRVRLFDRPDRLGGLRRNGLKARWQDGAVTEHRNFEFDATDAGDVLFLALKAHQIHEALPRIEPLLRRETNVVTVQNGIPWWYFQGDGAVSGGDGERLAALDPDGELARVFDPNRLIGCIAYPSAELAGDGHVNHVEGDRMPVGPVVGASRAAAEQVQRVLERSGFRARLLDDVRGEIWVKAIGTASLNPISALTRSTFAEICTAPETLTLARSAMREAAEVAAALGVNLRVTVERRLDGARKVGHHRSSMLQDLERGEALETDALLGAIVELGERTGVATPHLQTLHSLLIRLDKSRVN